MIRDVDRKGIIQLAAELGAASEKARAGKLSLDDMQGAGFTITNLGGIGGTSFTPIVNWPEVAILGISRGAREPVFVNDQSSPPDVALVAVLRSSRDRWRRRRAVSALGSGSVRTALRDVSLMSASTQLVVIGAGPGGYAAAFYTADRGHEGDSRRSLAESGRRLPLPRLHPVEGVAACRRDVNEAKRGGHGVTFSTPKIEIDKVRAFRTRS